MSSLWSSTAQSMSDFASISKKELQILKPFLFIWIDSKVNESDRIQASIQILKENQIDIFTIDDWVKLEQWLESYKSSKQIILVTCEKFGKKIIPSFHDLQSIIAIYMYSSGRKVSSRWVQKYSKVHKVGSDTNQLMKLISRNLTDHTIIDLPESYNLIRKRSDDDDADTPKMESSLNKCIKIQSASLDTFRFVLIDLSTRLNETASAMLKCLCSLVKDGIIIDDNTSLIELKKQPNKHILYFVSSEFAATMMDKLEQDKDVFILENEKNKVDYWQRFHNCEDLIFQLADEIYRCYIKEASDCSRFGDSLMAKEKQDLANRIHGELKKAYKSMQTVDDIRFNYNIYGLASYWTLLLYGMDGPHIPINLSHASLMSFIQVFNDVVQCERHIERNLQKMITLFAYGHNIETWLATNRSLPANLREINIFCHSDDLPYIIRGMQRHIHRHRNITFGIIAFDSLNYNLLLFGVDHLKALHSEFGPNSPELRQSLKDYKRISHALANYFWHEANN